MEKFQELIMKMAETQPNAPLTPAHKTLLQNRLTQLVAQYKTPDHPPYSAMIERAIEKLNEKGGSTEESISQFLLKEYNDLPWAHLTLLQYHLARLCESGEIILTRRTRYVLGGANLSRNATEKSKRELWKRDWEKQMKRQHKELTIQKRNQQKRDKTEGTGKQHLEHTVQEKRLIERGLAEDKYPGLPSPEKPSGFELARVDNLFPQEQYLTVEKTSLDDEQLQLEYLSSEVQDKKESVVNLTLEIKSNVHKRKRNVRGKRTSVKYGQAENSSQAIIVAEPKKRKYQKRLKVRGLELLSMTLRRSPRLQNNAEQLIREEKPNFSTVEVPLDLKPKLVSRETRLSKRLAELSGNLSNSEVPHSLRLGRPQNHQRIESELTLIVKEQDKPVNQISEDLKVDVSKSKSERIKMYDRRRKVAFQQSAENELAVEVRKSQTSSICQYITSPNDQSSSEPVIDARTYESHSELAQLDSRKRLRPRKQKSIPKVKKTRKGQRQSIECVADSCCTALVLRGEETLLPGDPVSNFEQKLGEEWSKNRRLGRLQKHRLIGSCNQDRMESLGIEEKCETIKRKGHGSPRKEVSACIEEKGKPVKCKGRGRPSKEVSTLIEEKGKPLERKGRGRPRKKVSTS